MTPNLEVAMLDSGPRTATALALMDSKVLALDRDDLILLFQQEPEAALNMLASLSGLTHKADELWRTRVSRNVNQEMEVHSTNSSMNLSSECSAIKVRRSKKRPPQTPNVFGLFVANLWTESSAHDRYGMVKNGNGYKNA